MVSPASSQSTRVSAIASAGEVAVASNNRAIAINSLHANNVSNLEHLTDRSSTSSLYADRQVVVAINPLRLEEEPFPHKRLVILGYIIGGIWLLGSISLFIASAVVYDRNDENKTSVFLLGSGIALFLSPVILPSLGT